MGAGTQARRQPLVHQCRQPDIGDRDENKDVQSAWTGEAVRDIKQVMANVT